MPNGLRSMGTNLRHKGEQCTNFSTTDGPCFTFENYSSRTIIITLKTNNYLHLNHLSFVVIVVICI